MIYDKLGRDEKIEHIKSVGGVPIFHIANKEEYWTKLKEKPMEEVNEFIESESEEELVDILEVIDAIMKYKKFDKGKVLDVKRKKANEMGKFKKMIILEES